MEAKWGVIGAGTVVLLGAAITAFALLGRIGAGRGSSVKLSDGPPIPTLQIVHEVDNQTHVRFVREGVPLFAEIYRPRGSEGPWPAVIVIPGGFEGPNYQNRLLCKELARKGYLAALPHLRGTGESGGEITFCLEEGRDVQDLARALPQVGSSGPYAYVGISFGGAIGLNAAQNDPDLRGVALVLSPTDFRQQHQMLTRWGLDDKVKKWEEWIGGSPASAPEEWDRRDPLDFAKSVRAPLLILQAGKDVLVPARQSSRLAEVRTDLGRKVNVAALSPEGVPWSGPLGKGAESIPTPTGLGSYHEDNFICFAEMPHATNEAVLGEVFKAVDAWLKD